VLFSTVQPSLTACITIASFKCAYLKVPTFSGVQLQRYLFKNNLVVFADSYEELDLHALGFY